jgi:hypothetical protein
MLHSRSPAHPQSRSTKRAFLALAAIVSTLLFAAQPAAATSIGEKIALRCTHNQSLSGFTQSDYKKALQVLEADAEEYSICAEEIREAQLAAARAAAKHGGGGSGSAGSGGAPTSAPLAATPAEQRAITHAQRAGSEPVKLGGGVVHPGVVHVDVASALSSLPTPVLAILALLLAGLVLVAGGGLRNRARGRSR